MHTASGDFVAPSEQKKKNDAWEKVPFTAHEKDFQVGNNTRNYSNTDALQAQNLYALPESRAFGVISIGTGKVSVNLNEENFVFFRVSRRSVNDSLALTRGPYEIRPDEF